MPRVSEQDYRTKDFATAVCLKALGIPLLGVEKGGEDFLRFVFKVSTDSAQIVMRQYWNHELMVDANTLLTAVRELKVMIHSYGEHV